MKYIQQVQFYAHRISKKLKFKNLSSVIGCALHIELVALITDSPRISSLRISKQVSALVRTRTGQTIPTLDEQSGWIRMSRTYSKNGYYYVTSYCIDASTYTLFNKNRKYSLVITD